MSFEFNEEFVSLDETADIVTRLLAENRTIFVILFHFVSMVTEPES
jgi:hypothetical protein